MKLGTKVLTSRSLTACSRDVAFCCLERFNTPMHSTPYIFIKAFSTHKKTCVMQNKQGQSWIFVQCALQDHPLLHIIRGNISFYDADACMENI